MLKDKSIGNLEIKDNGKLVKIPYYHDPKMNCGCMTCRLANDEISLDFYKGYFLGTYISKLYAMQEGNQSEIVLDDKYVNLFFSESELADFITGA